MQSNLFVRGDQDQLRSAVSNLVYNAIHYTPAERKISVEWRKQGAMALFVVQDEGEGIPPEHLARLTERFYRVDRPARATRVAPGWGSPSSSMP